MTANPPGGVRIRHHTRRNQTLPVPLLHKPFPVPQPVYNDCPECKVWHPCKTLHLRLDDTGAVIVSHEIWADLQKTVNNGGFRVANLVTKPPTQTVTPPTIKVKLEGVDLAGTIAHTGPRRETFTTAGKRSTTRDAQPAVRTVTVDEYLDTAGTHGVGEVPALNLLLAKVLREGAAVKGE